MNNISDLGKGFLLGHKAGWRVRTGTVEATWLYSEPAGTLSLVSSVSIAWWWGEAAESLRPGADVIRGAEGRDSERRGMRGEAHIGQDWCATVQGGPGRPGTCGPRSSQVRKRGSKHIRHHPWLCGRGPEDFPTRLPSLCPRGPSSCWKGPEWVLGSAFLGLVWPPGEKNWWDLRPWMIWTFWTRWLWDVLQLGTSRVLPLAGGLERRVEKESQAGGEEGATPCTALHLPVSLRAASCHTGDFFCGRLCLWLRTWLSPTPTRGQGPPEAKWKPVLAGPGPHDHTQDMVAKHLHLVDSLSRAFLFPCLPFDKGGGESRTDVWSDLRA